MDALPVIALMLPVAGMLAVLLAGGNLARPVALVFLLGGCVVAGMLVAAVWRSGDALTYNSGGWAPPLGIALRADGLSALMIATTAVVALAAGLYALRGADATGPSATRLPQAFWFLLLGVCGAMNAVFLGNDLFNLYVAIELITFAGVPLVCIKGSPETFQAALRYLVFALVGSALYLLGAVILYGAYGTLDLTLLAQRVRPELSLWVAVSVMTLGLAAKTALFPLHLWLPPAHAGAPPAASALLSALVVKGSFFLTVRIWFDLMPGVATGLAGQIPGVMGAGAIVVGGVMALRQERLKLLIAYSTVAQIGYLFLIFPMASDPHALSGGMFQAVSHALAKAAMFMAAGLMAEAAGSDRLHDMRGMGRRLPLTVLAFTLAALSLVGVPPTGGFMTKWLLISASAGTGQWWWAAVVLVGGLLAGGYMFRALMPAFENAEHPCVPVSVSRLRQCVVLILAAGAILLGVFARQPLELIDIGRTPHERSLP